LKPEQELLKRPGGSWTNLQQMETSEFRLSHLSRKNLFSVFMNILDCENESAEEGWEIS